MKILFFGDIYGRVWRKALLRELPSLKEKYTPDFIIANVDNITSGRGAVESHVDMVSTAWVDICTGGDHIFDNLDSIKSKLDSPDSNLLRPGNLYGGSDEVPWVWEKVFYKDGKKLLMIHALWEIFINHKVKNPFHWIDGVLEKYASEKLDAICVDFHKEVTSESQALGLYLDGKVTFVWGTHTHVQTNDARILPQGTGFITDVWMNGSLNSVIGADFWSVRKRFLTGIQKGKIEQSLAKDYVVSGVYIETSPGSLQCSSIETIKIYGTL